MKTEKLTKADIKKWLKRHDDIESAIAERMMMAIFDLYFETEPKVIADFKVALFEIMKTEEYKIMCKDRAKEWIENSLLDPETMENLWEINEFRQGMTKFVMGILQKEFIKSRGGK